MVDGLNISVQHYNESIADEIRRTVSKYNRQSFYASLPNKHKIRLNINLVKPFLCTKDDVINCLLHYDKMGFNMIKLAELQDAEESFISFENIFNIKYGSPFYHGCQTILNTKEIPELITMKTPLLLKRSCFFVENSLKASLMDGVKILYKKIITQTGKFGVIHNNGTLTGGWLKCQKKK